MLFLLSDNFGRRAAEERSHAEHGNEDKQRVIFAIPPNATAAQKRALDRAVEYGNRADINVEVIIKVVK